MRFSQLTRFRMGTLLVTIALITAACGSDDNDAGADLITQTGTVADASVVIELDPDIETVADASVVTEQTPTTTTTLAPVIPGVMPDVRGLDLDTALAQIRDAELQFDSVLYRDQNEHEFKGDVISAVVDVQMPRAGTTEFAPGTVLDFHLSQIVLSDPPTHALTPDMVGLDLPAARNLLRTRGLTATRTFVDVDGNSVPGTDATPAVVVAQDPAVRVPAARDTPVRLILEVTG